MLMKKKTGKSISFLIAFIMLFTIVISSGAIAFAENKTTESTEKVVAEETTTQDQQKSESSENVDVIEPEQKEDENSKKQMSPSPRGPSAYSTHLVRFYDWDNVQIGLDQNITHGEAAVEPSTPSRPGYRFIGWDKDTSAIFQDTDFIAQYVELNIYTITINYVFQDSTMASQPNISTIEEGADINQNITSPTIAGFVADLPVVNVNVTNASQNYTYDVKYTPNPNTPYKVKHYQERLDLSGFDEIETDNLNGATGNVVTAVAKSYDGFSAPANMPQAAIAADGNTTLKVYYTRNIYAVYFNTDEGSYVEPIPALYGATITPPANPTKSGYSFAGWSPSFPSTMPAEDVNLTAQWDTPSTVSLTYVYWLEDIQGGGLYNYVGSESGSGTAGTAPTIPGSIPSGITFPIPSNRYSINNTKTNSELPTVINGNGSTIVNVYYDRNEYTMSFSFDATKYTLTVNGTMHSSSPYTFTAKYGADITSVWPGMPQLIPGKQSDGNFIGWLGADNVNYVTRQLNLAENHINATTYTAAWQVGAKLVSVKYLFENINGVGETENYAQTLYTNVNATQWNAKNFTGFTVIPPSVVTITNNEAVFHYSRNDYNISFYSNNAIDSTKTAIPYQSAIDSNYYVPPTPANLPGYTFGGWYKTPQFFAGSEFDFAGKTMPAYNLILYAKWNPPVFDVTFDPDNGSSTFVQPVTLNENVAQPQAPTRQGYTFNGWFRDPSPLRYIFNFKVTSSFTLKAHWIPSNNLSYDVIHMVNGAPYQTNTFGGQTTGTTVTANSINIPGYIPDSTSKSLSLSGSGDQIIFYYTPFAQKEYTVKYQDTGGVDLLLPVTNHTSNTSVTENYQNIAGYSPDKYQKTIQISQDSSANIIIFVYKKNAAVNYQVYHYKEKLNGSYEQIIADNQTFNAAAGQSVTGTPKNYNGFTYSPGLSQATRVVASNGSTVLHLYYLRDLFTQNFVVEPGGQGSLFGISTFSNIKYDTPFGTVVTAPTPVANPGYKFKQWDKMIPNPGDPVIQNDTYVASFEKDDAQWAEVFYDANGQTGSMASSGEILIGSSYSILPNQFTSLTDDFVGWNTKPDGTGTAYVSGNSFNLTEDTTLFAQWVAKDRWGVIYFPNGGSGNMIDSGSPYINGNTVTVMANGFSNPGYTFMGWNTTVDGIGGTHYNPTDTFDIHEDTLLFAQWQKDDSQWLKINYDGNGATLGSMSSDDGIIGQQYNIKNNVFWRDNFTFTGWNTESGGGGVSYPAGGNFIPVDNNNITLYAQWNENAKYKITYHANNGTADEIVDPDHYVNSVVISKPWDTFSFVNNDFVQWNTDPNGFGDMYMPNDTITMNGDLELYAIWNPFEQFTVDYEDGFSSGVYVEPSPFYINNSGISQDVTVRGNMFTHFGYIFDGWEIELDGVDTDSVAQPGNVLHNTQKNVTFVARWIPQEYNITYDLHDGTVALPNPTHYNIESPEFTLNNPTKPGYTFVGWSGTEITDSQTNVSVLVGHTGDRFYEAIWQRDDSQWSKIIFKTIDPNHGNLNGTLEFEGIKGQPVTGVNYPGTDPMAGYLFSTWSSVVPSEYPNEDMIIYADWKLVDSSVTDEKASGIIKKGNNSGTGDSNTIMWALIIAGVALAVAGVTIVIIKKRKTDETK